MQISVERQMHKSHSLLPDSGICHISPQLDCLPETRKQEARKRVARYSRCVCKDHTMLSSSYIKCMAPKEAVMSG